METIKVLVVDDEPLARERLRRLVDNCEEFEVVDEADNGSAAITYVHKYHPDIVLLDIRMPGMDGLEAARHMAKEPHPPAVIFTTAYGEHALEAFEAHAIDYLLKPIRQERLENSLQRAQRLSLAQLQPLEGSDGLTSRRRHICARMRGNLQLIPVEEIIYFQASQKYVTVRHCDGEVLIDDPLKSLEDEFKGLFIRIHRNALVAKAHIAGMNKDRSGRFYLQFREEVEPLEISRRHVAEVRSTVNAL